MSSFIGRQNELKQLNQLLEKKSASLVTVYGRRRIGKSSLIAHFAKDHRMLSFEGLSPRKAINKQDQLDEFSRQLARECQVPYKRFVDWGDAFFELSRQANKQTNKPTKQGRIIILLDEISWMGLEDPDFAGKIKIAWDRYFKKNSQLIFFICGSVSAWIKKNIVNNTGFHGRVSLKLCLRELPLIDCKKFWGSKELADAEIIKFIAVTGGIPKYLEEMNPKLTTEENIRRLAFTEGGILFNDFADIFTDTLQRKTELYERIVRLLCDGAVDSRDISSKINVPKGSYLSDLMDELVTAGFVSKQSSWDLKTGKISTVSQFRLSDNYLRFYLKYIAPHIEKIIAGNFSARSLNSLPGWTTIMSLQMENLVLNNRSKIKSLLNILPDEIICDNPYFQRATHRNQGCQIDYLIQTKYNNLYICEIKVTRSVIKRDVIDDVKEKIRRLKVPRYTSVRPVLMYLGDLHDEVIDADYFTHTINIETLMKS